MRFEKINDKEWLEREIQTKPLRQIAEEVGCSYGAVIYQVRKHGLVVPERFTRRPSPTRSENIKRKLKERYPEGRFGILASNWKGGRQIIDGYVFVYAPDHPRAGRDKRMQEHILVAEETLGRYLVPGEVVHHINHNDLDNRPENLEVKMRGDHVRDHFKEGYEAAQLKLENEALRQRIAELEAILDK